MPREDAQTLAKEKAQVMYEYLEQFLNDHRKVSGHLDIMSITNRLVANLLVTEEGKTLFEHDYDLQLPSIYADFLTEELSRLVLEKFMPSDYYGVSEYAFIRDLGPKNRDGFYVFNANGSKINVNYYAKGERFMPSDYYGVSEFAFIRDLGPKNRDGFYVFNATGSKIDVNFYAKGERYTHIMREHNKQVTEYRNKQKTR